MTRLTGNKSLREIGKEVGALDLENSVKASIGGVFTAEQLAKVARAAEFRADVYILNTPESFRKGICKSIDARIPVILAFDVRSGDPVLAQGEHAHWGIVIGYRNDPMSFIATHGHGKYYEWPQNDLTKSNFELKDKVHEQLPPLKVTISCRLTDAKSGKEMLNTSTGFIDPSLKNEDYIKTILRDSRPAWKTVDEIKQRQAEEKNIATLLKQRGLNSVFQITPVKPSRTIKDTYQAKMDLATKIILVRPKEG